MIEAFSIPILLKAIDFLFDEGRKILDERRERRKAQQAAETKPETISITHSEARDVIKSRELALAQQVSEVRWLDAEAEVKHLMSLLEIYTRNYYLAKEQCAKWGSALVPPIVLSNLIEAEDLVAATMKQLQDALSRVYGKAVTIPSTEQR